MAKRIVKSIYAPFYDCPPIMKEFLDYMMTIRGLSPRTVDGYYIELRTFLRFIKCSHEQKISSESIKNTPIDKISIEQICSVTISDIYSFLNFAATELLNGPAARARKTSAINSFYNYISQNTTIVMDNPAKQLRQPARKKSLPKYLTLDESNQLLDAVETTGSLRNWCILVLFLNCGMRLSELVGIDCADIRDDNTLRLLGKGNKERIIYLNDACREAISLYLESSKVVKRRDNALFVSDNGKRLSPRRVEQIVHEMLKLAGLSGYGYTPHKLRHTAATLMYQHGNVDVRILKEILGHADLSTTEIYTHVSNRQMEKAANSSPLSKRPVKKVKNLDS
jgi:site-specific recombinase XerD